MTEGDNRRSQRKHRQKQSDNIQQPTEYLRFLHLHKIQHVEYYLSMQSKSESYMLIGTVNRILNMVKDEALLDMDSRLWSGLSGSGNAREIPMHDLWRLPQLIRDLANADLLRMSKLLCDVTRNIAMDADQWILSLALFQQPNVIPNTECWCYLSNDSNRQLFNGRVESVCSIVAQDKADWSMQKPNFFLWGGDSLYPRHSNTCSFLFCSCPPPRKISIYTLYEDCSKISPCMYAGRFPPSPYIVTRRTSAAEKDTFKSRG